MMTTQRLALALALATLLLASCKSAPVASHRTPASAPNPPLEQGEVWGAEDEEIARQITEETRNIALENRKSGEPLRRDAHPKHHGCVKAFVTIDPSKVAPHNRAGFLADPKPQAAWLRLSNGDPKGFANPDKTSDVRGFALKIMNAPQTPQGSHDITAMSSTRFFSRDSEDYLDLFHALRGGKLSLAWYAARNWTNISIVRAAQITPENPLTTDYFVPVPTKITTESMRMNFRPCANNAARAIKPDKSRPNYLREGLVTALAKESACFDILLQVNKDPETNIIENPTLEWDAKVSPWQVVGRVDIPQQTGSDSAERMAFCENLSFNPWNAHPDLRPMGQINRARKIVYDEISRMRHQENQVPQIEPRDHNACQGETASLCK